MNERLTFDIFFNMAQAPLIKSRAEIDKFTAHSKRQLTTLEQKFKKLSGKKNLHVGTADVNKAKYSIAQLETRLDELRHFRKISVNFSDIKRANREIAKTEAQMKRMQAKGVGGFGRTLESSGLGGMMGYMGAGAAVAGIGSLVKGVFDIRRERQKQEAVLTTAFMGNNEQAKMQMVRIEQFASRTPYSVNELTDAFIKLKNQGFDPSTEQMRKMGDLAASTGKSFDQLAEAILDAQMGEFERLKEFGIKARVHGDKIKFIFKEQETVVQNSAAAIQKYLLGLGDLKGVMGSMEGISKTLDGQVSNLGDSWDRLLNTMGQSDGVFSGIITGLGEILDGLNALSKTKDQNLDYGKTEQYDIYKSQAQDYFNVLKNKGIAEKRAMELTKEYMRDNLKDTQEYLRKDIDKQIKRKISSVVPGHQEQNKFIQNIIESDIGKMKGAFTFMKDFDAILNPKKKTTNSGSSVNTGSSGGFTGLNKEIGQTVSDARRAKNLTINITKLIETVNFSTTNLHESAAAIKDEVQKALLTAVNDANYAMQ